MKTITRQSVLKAFYRFDQRRLPLLEINGVRVQGRMDVALRRQLCDAWLSSFCTVDTETWDKAVDLALAECLAYPDEAAMWDFISRATGSPAQEQEKAEQAPAPPEAEAQAPPAARPAGNISRGERIRRMLELAKQGRFEEARSCGGKVPSAEEIFGYAKAHWPDCSREWAQDNERYIRELLAEERRCAKCVTGRHCRSNGCKVTGIIDKYSGRLELMVYPCSVRRMNSKDENLP